MKPTTDQLKQLLDLPDEILVIEKTINGLKSEKAKKLRDLAAMTARHQLRISSEMGKSNADDRKAALVIACEDDPKLSAVQERLDQIAGMLRAYDAQRDHLRRTREGLRVQGGLYIVARLEELLKDKDLASAIGGGLLA